MVLTHTTKTINLLTVVGGSQRLGRWVVLRPGKRKFLKHKEKDPRSLQKDYEQAALRLLGTHTQMSRDRAGGQGLLQGSKQQRLDKQKCSWRQEGKLKLVWAKISAFASLNLRCWMMSTKHLETLTESQMVRLLVPRTKARLL